MNRWVLFLGLILSFATASAQEVKIAFGSCSDEDDSVQLWKEIAAVNPDLWVWLGDNIYGDTDNPEILRQKYQLQKSNPDYQQLLRRCPVIGTWDDHDYGLNDGGNNFAQRDESKEAFVEFMGYPLDHEINGHRGVYHSYLLPAGAYKIKVILLDTRYFRDDLQPAKNPALRYEPTSKGDLLGEAQWEWLERELLKRDAAVTIIGSSIQFIAREQGFEKWYNLTSSYTRMLKLLARTNPSNPIFISGDRHFAEISRMEVKGLPFPLFDFTSSGLTQVYKLKEEKNTFRVGGPVTERNFGVINIKWVNSQPVIGFSIIGTGGTQYLEWADINSVK